MRKSRFSLTLICAVSLFWVGCDHLGTSKDNIDPVTEWDYSVLEMDSIAIDTAWISTHPNEGIADMEGSSMKFSMEFPSYEKYPLLSNAVFEWVGESVKMDLIPGENLRERLLGQFFAVDRMFNTELEYAVHKVFENERLVTFVLSSYHYSEGAAHGLFVLEGATFRKQDGKVFGWNMFKDGTIDNDLINRGLKEFFEVKSNADLEQELMLESPYCVTYLPRPQSRPWEEADGIHFHYQSYEIACYASGQPEFTVPVDTLLQQLSATMLRMIK